MDGGMINERLITGFVILFFVLVVTPEVALNSYERFGYIGYAVPPLIAIVLSEVVVTLRAKLRRRKKSDF